MTSLNRHTCTPGVYALGVKTHPGPGVICFEKALEIFLPEITRPRG